MYDPEDMQPGSLEPGELDLMPPHFRLTQEARPDFGPWQETPHQNHGFNSHRMDPALGRRNMAIYYGMISFMDQQIGRMLATLDRLGIAENTIVIFTTDHGHFLGQHGLWYKGAFHYEDLVRLPFIVRWPGQVPAGQVSSALQSLVDLAPTFLEAADAPISGAMQGRSQLDVWRGQAALARDHVLVENRHQPTAVHLRTYIDGRYKLTVYRNAPYGELFDLQDDPDERHNLWDDAAHADLKRELLHRFVQAEIAREPTRFPRIAVA
jgi:uncharacterized sulfatase